MALLTPNAAYKMNGVTVREKIIPDGTVWKDADKAKKAGFSGGSLYKKQQKLTNKTGKVKSVTIHNTDDIRGVNDDAEQYTRATYNENMGSARIHFYVDDLGAWQNLKAGTGLCSADPVGSAEVSWHAGDGSVADGGNMTSISMEIIMNDTAAHDEKAKDNGARIAAWLLYKHGLSVDKLVTHTYWVNKSVGNNFDDVDKQCTNLVSGKKWCPAYIFASYNETTALKNWKSFKALVKKYLDALKSPASASNAASTNTVKENVETKVNEGDLVKVSTGAVWMSGKAVPSFVINDKWYVKSVSGSRVVIDKNENGSNSVMSPIDAKYLTVVKSGKIEEGDKVKLAKDAVVYGTNRKFASFVYSSTLYVRDITGSRAVISTLQSGAVTGAVDIKYLNKI